jgi:hypothetical protein
LTDFCYIEEKRKTSVNQNGETCEMDEEVEITEIIK